MAEAIVREVGRETYEPCDLDPGRYAYVPGIRKLDLCKDVFELPSDHYDLILHSHVMEHIPCNYAVVLLHLQRALAPDGMHICSIPILPGYYDETTRELEDCESVARFGQHDHVRRFGADDLEFSLGMLFSLAAEYDITRDFDQNELLRANIPEYAWTGYTQHSVLTLGKQSTRV